MLETVIKRQESEKRRIHKGSYFHNIGFSLVLQNRLLDALRNFLLAYIEDSINTSINQEARADTAPAARVLKRGFLLRTHIMETIKEIVISKKQNQEIILNPEDVLAELLENVHITEDDLFSLCTKPPHLDQAKDTLFVNLTPEAKSSLDQIVTKMTNRVLQRAATIAKKRNSKVVTGDDVKKAIKQLEREQI